MSVLLLMGALLAAPTPPPVAVVIGSNASRNGENDLNFADNDALHWAEYFRSFDARVRLLASAGSSTDPARHAALRGGAKLPTRRRVLAAIRSAIAELPTHQGQLFIVFIGHGYVDAHDGRLQLEDGGVLFGRELQAILRPAARYADRINIVLDACHANSLGRAVDGALQTADLAVSISEPLRRYGRIFATRAGQKTVETAELRAGLFSHVVLGGLRGNADANGDGRISFRELNGYLVHRFTGPPFGNPPEPIVRGPDDNPDREIMPLPPRGALLRGVRTHGGHIAVTTAEGERLHEIWSAADGPDVVRLPVFDGDVYIHRVGEDVHARVRLRSDGQLALGDLRFEPREAIASRGPEEDYARGVYGDGFGARALRRVDRIAERAKRIERRRRTPTPAFALTLDWASTPSVLADVGSGGLHSVGVAVQFPLAGWLWAGLRTRYAQGTVADPGLVAEDADPVQQQRRALVGASLAVRRSLVDWLAVGLEAVLGDEWLQLSEIEGASGHSLRGEVHIEASVRPSREVAFGVRAGAGWNLGGIEVWRLDDDGNGERLAGPAGLLLGGLFLRWTP